MDQTHRQVTVQIGWRPGTSSLDDQVRDNQLDFDEFAKFVVRALQHHAVVETRTIYGIGNSMREVKFSASAALSLEEWTNAIQAAVKSCRVMTDQSMWSFE
jgi:hypothetical protein